MSVHLRLRTPTRHLVQRTWLRTVLILAGGLFASCSTDTPTAPGGDRPEPPPVAPEIMDAAHSAEIDHFYFLPPMVADPTTDGTFDASLTPEVEICELDGSGASSVCATVIATYTMTTGPGSETVRLEAADEHYIVNWHTDEFSLDPVKTYRITVRVAGTRLGWADVDVVSNGSQLKNVDTEEYIALKDGRTLPIKFRIEEGAVFVVGAAGGRIVAEGGAVVLDVPAGAIAGDVGITIEEVTDLSGVPPEVSAMAGSVYELGPDGTTFDEPVELTLSFDEAAIPSDADETRLAIYTEENGEWIELSTVIDFDANTATTLIEGFSQKAVGVSGGYSHTCAVVGTDVYCWGANDFGQLGDGTLSSSPSPKQALGGPYADVVAGPLHTCALRTDGTVNCWGRGDQGQLGNSTRPQRQASPVQVLGGPYVELTLGWGHSCALKSNGTAECWGDGRMGQLGESNRIVRSSPVQVLGGPYTEISAKGYHTCGREADGTVECWGRNHRGQLGDGSTSVRSSPVTVQGGPYAAISVGFRHTCGLRSDGSVECWGDGSLGMLGQSISNATTPVQTAAGPYEHISSGTYHNCGLTANGTAECWGYGAWGQLGNGPTQIELTPVQAQGGSYTEVDAGWYTTCALTTAGRVECWGGNWAAQAGTGSASSSVDTPQEVQGLPIPPTITPLAPSRVSAGESRTCVVTLTGGIECWGRGGAIGTDIVTGSTVPVTISDPVQGPQIYTMVTVAGVGNSTSGNHACGLSDAGEIFCWGFGHLGQLGQGVSSSSGIPVRLADPVEGPQAWVWVSAGQTHSCAVTQGGEVYCWGENDHGQLGDGGTSPSNMPVLVQDPTTGAESFLIVAAGGSHSCALAGDGEVFCWGEHQFNRLGDSSLPSGDYSTPVLVVDAGARQFGLLEAENNHTCGVETDGTAYCWGVVDNAFSNGSPTFLSIGRGVGHGCAIKTDGTGHCTGSNTHGQLGTGDNVASNSLTPVTGGHAWESIAAGTNHTCGIRTDGEVMCWGLNSDGQLGNGTTTSSNKPVETGASGWAALSADQGSVCAIDVQGDAYCGFGTAAPTLVPGGLAVAEIDVGLSLNRCLVTVGGDGYCWGNNADGQLGDGTNASSTTPVPVSGSLEFVEIETGWAHSCGLVSSGDIYCWGSNSGGTLGIGSGSPGSSNTPLLVTGGHQWTDVSIGAFHSCGVTTGGEAYCWGNNNFGKLGNAGGVAVAPTLVSGGHSWSSVEAGSNHTCGIDLGGAAYCWGDNSQGALGDGGGVATSSLPVAVTGGITFASIVTSKTGNQLASHHTCGLNTAGVAYCWGRNVEGQLGDATNVNRTAPVAVVAGLAFDRLAAMRSATCGLLDDRSAIYCWGVSGTTNQPTLVPNP